MHHGKAVDKILEVPNTGDTRLTSVEDEPPNLDTLQASKRHLTSTFVQARPQKVKNGTSIHDDPSTWDLESDQLADELAALAIEIDPELQQKLKAEPVPMPIPTPQDTPMQGHDDEYIYETYVRISCDDDDTSTAEAQASVGILVIDEEDEDLWQKYVDSGEDTDWDEEDSNGRYPTFSNCATTDCNQPRTTLQTTIPMKKLARATSLATTPTNIAPTGPIMRTSMITDGPESKYPLGAPGNSRSPLTTRSTPYFAGLDNTSTAHALTRQR